MNEQAHATDALCTTSGCGKRTPYFNMRRTGNGNFCNKACEQQHIADVREHMLRQKANQK